MLDWLIVGGGIHGVHLAARLMGEAKVEGARLRLVDPDAALLGRWRRCTVNTGMTHLRSPAVHHLDLEPFALERFAGAKRWRRARHFAAPYDRPSLALFNAHCDTVMARYDLASLHLRTSATALDLSCEGARATTAEGGSLEARHVILALGAGDQPAWPSWAKALREERPDGVHHIFEAGFALDAARRRSDHGVGHRVALRRVPTRLERGRRSFAFCIEGPLAPAAARQGRACVALPSGVYGRRWLRAGPGSAGRA